MLYVMLVFSLFQLAVANWIVWRARHPRTGVLCAGLVFGVAPLCLTCFLPAVSLQALLLCVAVVVWRLSRRDRPFFPALSSGATLVSYAMAGLLVAQSEREYASLRQLYPYESMEERLPEPKLEWKGTPLSANAERRLLRLDGQFEVRTDWYRAHQLETLHEDAVGLFVNSPGFGAVRMGHVTRWGLAAHTNQNVEPMQPGSRPVSEWSPGEPERLPLDDVDLLACMHEASILDFADARGYGYFKDRCHVAGFVPHQFNRVPAPDGRWQLRTLELVGLVVHDEPVVYVSDRLPRMSALHTVRTRPLDRFERFGLQELTRGDDLFVAPAAGGLRILGAVRAARACVNCHGGARGDLLGAFSYMLEPIASTGREWPSVTIGR